jgi:hypothetical protein
MKMPTLRSVSALLGYTPMNLYFQTDMHSHLIRYSISLAAAIGLHSPALADHHEKPVDLAGIWNATASADAGDDRKIVWTIEKDGDKYTGTSIDSESGEERKLDRISVEEKKSELSSTLILSEPNAELKGRFQSAEGDELEIGKVKPDGKNLTLDSQDSDHRQRRC